MTTIHGIINRGIVNSELQFEKMGYISSNVSNYNTHGYKAVRFEQILDENGIAQESAPHAQQKLKIQLPNEACKGAILVKVR